MGLNSQNWRGLDSWAARCFLLTSRCCRSGRCGPLRLARSVPSRKRSHLRRLQQLLHTAGLALQRVSPEQQTAHFCPCTRLPDSVLLYIWQSTLWGGLSALRAHVVMLESKCSSLICCRDFVEVWKVPVQTMACLDSAMGG